MQLLTTLKNGIRIYKTANGFCLEYDGVRILTPLHPLINENLAMNLIQEAMPKVEMQSCVELSESFFSKQ